jgi:biotin carboxyl carrier protein
MVFKIPRPIWTQAIVDKAGLATKAFSRRIEEAFGKIETQEASQDTTLGLIQQVQAEQAAQLALIQAAQAQATSASQAANEAQSTADAAGGGTARSGTSIISAQPISGTVWNNGPAINLAGVVAGDLTITGSGPTGGALTAGNALSGEFRLVELVGSTTLFTGSFLITDSGVTNYSAADVAAFVAAEVTTGAVSYRFDVRRSGGSPGSTGTISLYGYVRRA